MALLLPGYSTGAERPHGLPPADDATYIPQLAGLLNKNSDGTTTGRRKNWPSVSFSGAARVKEGKVSVPAGGFFYASSTSLDAKPLRSDPFLILGETSYLLSLKTAR